MRRGKGIVIIALLSWGCSGSDTTPPGDECKEGEHKCDPTGTKEILCTKTTAGALRWGNPVLCSGGGKCVNGSCEAACGDCTVPPDSCHKAEGTCWNGECMYDPVEDGVSCDDLNPCTEKDSCQAGVCMGIQKDCSTPPANTCKDANVLTVYTSPGTCAKGSCTYPMADVTCPMGCDSTSTPNVCKGDPCKGVICRNPPSECHKAEGFCVNGQCNYNYEDGKICDDEDTCTISDKCVGGTCTGTPKSCNTPPANKCKDANTLTHYPKTGACKDGDCVYDPTEEACSHGCDQALGACKGDPCADVTCESPINSCYKSPGVCEDGKCKYELDNGKACNDNNSCTTNDTCSLGVCSGSPVICNTPPKNVCLDANNLKVYTAPGSCVGGQCQYGSTTVACAFGCDSALSPNICKGDPCATMACNTPPNNQCYTVPGLCSYGTCTYLVKYGASCDDKIACTHTDKCSSTGTCVGTVYSCSDGLVCTTDTCDGSGGCNFPVAANSCLIPLLTKTGIFTYDFVDTCYAKDAFRSTTETCQYCKPTSNKTNWTVVSGTQVLLWDFDSGNNEGFTFVPQGSSTVVGWQVDTKRYSSATYSLYYGRLSDHTFNGGTVSGDATSPSVALPGASGKLCLEFRMWKETETDYFDYDRLTLHVKPLSSPTDGGVGAETQVWLASAEPPNWGNSTYFRTYSVNVSDWAGQTVQFRFHFDSGDSIENDYEGIYLDNIRVIKNCTP